MKNLTVKLAALIGLGASSTYGQTMLPLIEASKKSTSVDLISLKLTPQQRNDLYKVLNEMGAEIGDWKSYSSDAAPSRCTHTSLDNYIGEYWNVLTEEGERKQND